MSYLTRTDGKGWPDGDNYHPVTPSFEPTSRQRKREKRKQQKVSRYIRRLTQLIKSQDGQCFLCGKTPMFHEMNIDHLLPLSKGGKRGFENEVAACIVCNTRKGDRGPTPEQQVRKKIINDKEHNKRGRNDVS